VDCLELKNGHNADGKYKISYLKIFYSAARQTFMDHLSRITFKIIRPAFT